MKRINFVGETIFIHIPKNAGTSLMMSFGNEKSTHITASQISELIDIKKYFVFSIVRNPIERFISLYNYARMEISYYHNNINPKSALYGKHLDYELLKNASLYECAVLLTEGKLKHDDSWNQWKPQYTWLYDNENNCLVDKVYSLDNLEELKEDFKLKGFNIEIPKINVSKATKSILDDNTQEIVRNFYKKDFELFKY